LNIDKVKSLLRLANKGRMLVIGKTAVLILINRKRASLILLAIDASQKLKQKIELECRRMSIPIYIFGNKSELGELCGRDSVAVLAISDRNLANAIKNELL